MVENLKARRGFKGRGGVRLLVVTNLHRFPWDSTASCRARQHQTQGRVAVPNRMNFRKSSKGGGHFQSKNLRCRFLELLTGFFEHEIDTKDRVISGFRVCFFFNDCIRKSKQDTLRESFQANLQYFCVFVFIQGVGKTAQMWSSSKCFAFFPLFLSMMVTITAKNKSIPDRKEHTLSIRPDTSS